MNIILITSLSSLLIARVILHAWLNLRQRRALLQSWDSVPAAFRHQFSLEEHQKSIRYAVTKLNFSTARTLFSSLVMVTWLTTGVMGLLDSILFVFVNDPVWQTIAFFGAFSFVEGLLSLPWSLYSQFVIEEKFGFNKMNSKIFITDMLKATLLSVILGVILGYPFVSLVHHVRGFWFIPAYLLFMSFQFLILWIFPTFIAPLFNKFSLLTDESLSGRIKQLVEKAGFQSQGVFVMDASKRSAHGNAYFTGIGKSKRIVFFDTLLTQLTSGQVLAVLAHEVGHLAHKHILKRLGVSLITTMIGFTFLGWWALRPDLVIDLGLSPSYGPTLLTGVWVLSLVTFPLSPISNWWSRKHEFQADQYAVQETSAQDLGLALLELYRKNAGSLVVDQTYAAWNYSHPPLTERLAAMGYNGESSKD